MKNGKLILGDILLKIEYNQNPTLIFNEKNNNDGTKQLVGNGNWYPFKFKIIKENKIDGKYKLFNSAFIIPDGDSNIIWKLKKCKINLNFNEIIFDKCEYYE